MSDFFSLMGQFVMDYLDPIGVVAGLIIMIPVFWTWWELVFGKRRQYKKWHREVRQHAGERPGILVVDLLPGIDISTDFENFRQQSDALKSVPENRIFKIQRKKPTTPDNMIQLSLELREKAASLKQSGVDHLHYFHAGPSVVAALVGAEFSNSCRVFLYHRDKGQYINFGPLKLEE